MAAFELVLVEMHPRVTVRGMTIGDALTIDHGQSLRIGRATSCDVCVDCTYGPMLGGRWSAELLWSGERCTVTKDDTAPARRD